MPSRWGSEGGRRRLLAAGTAGFSRLLDANLPEVPAELERISTTFQSLGYETRPTVVDPDRQLLLNVFSELRKDCEEGDVLVAYYTGHGARDTERFYLLTRDSDVEDLDATAVAAEDWARAVAKGSNAFQILLILDTCYAGAGSAEIAAITSRLVTSLAGKGPGVFILAAARAKQEAEQGALSLALERALANEDERLGGAVQQYLAMDKVMDVVNDYLLAHHPTQAATYSSVNVHGGCRLFPNPKHRSVALAGLDLETQRAFDEHWVPKARGSELGATGWYFTGRIEALRALVGWLSRERSDGAMRVVTGGPGCGKSAVLGRLATLSHPFYRRLVVSEDRATELQQELIPAEGVVNVAIHARHKLLGEVVKQIALALELSAELPNELLQLLTERTDKVVILIDALDESDDREAITSQLVKPLARLTQVFLIVACRPDAGAVGKRVESLGGAAVEIDLDDPRYIGRDDVAIYVSSRLQAKEEPSRRSPYRGQAALASTVAEAVSARAKGLFLVAHTAVHALLARPAAIDTSENGWADRLPTGLGDAFTQFLSEIEMSRPGGLRASTVKAVLLPLAFAEGEGLPWLDIWGAVATSLCGSVVSDADISLVRKHAAPFIVEALEQSHSAYRLYHERLAEHLRDTLPDGRWAHRRIVDALCAQLPDQAVSGHRDWLVAHDYLLTHLATHARKAGYLWQLVEDGSFLSAADPIRMLQALDLDTDAHIAQIRGCYRLAFDSLRDQPPAIRLSYLEMMARQQGRSSLADVWAAAHRDDCQWRVPWARWGSVAEHRCITLSDPVVSVAAGVLAGQFVIASSTTDGAVQFWDLATGLEVGHALAIRGHVRTLALGNQGDELAILIRQLHEVAEIRNAATAELISSFRWDGDIHRARCLTLCTIDGRLMAVAGNEDRSVSVINVVTGQQFGLSLRGLWRAATSVSVYPMDSGSPLVCATDGMFVHLWDMASCDLLGTFRCGDSKGQEPVTAIAVGVWNGRAMVVTGGHDRTVRLWDVLTGQQVGDALRGHNRPVTAVALVTIGGRCVAVSGSDDRSVRLWDLNSAQQPHEPSAEEFVEPTAVTPGIRDGQSVVVTGDQAGFIRVWNAKSGRELLPAMSGHAGHQIRSVATAAIAGKSVLVSGGADRTVRVWELAAGMPLRMELEVNQASVAAVAVAQAGSLPIIVSGSAEGRVRVWLGFGSSDPNLTFAHGGHVSCVAIGFLSDAAVVISGNDEGSLKVWDLTTGIQRGAPLKGHSPWVRAVAAGTFGDHAVAVSGGDDRTVRLWSLPTGLPYRHPLKGHSASVTSVAIGVLHGRPTIASGGADGLIVLWDEHGQTIAAIQTSSPIRQLALAPPSNILVAGERGLLSILLFDPQRTQV